MDPSSPKMAEDGKGHEEFFDKVGELPS